MSSHFIELFLEYCREQRGLSINSLTAYRQDLQSFSRFLGESLVPGENLADTQKILGYQKYLREVIGSSPATIRRRMITLKSYFRWAHMQGHISGSPFDGLALELKVPQRLPRPVDRSTLGRLLGERKVCGCTALVTRLLIVTGLRIGEATHLRIGDVCALGRKIRVRGKGSRERCVYVTNQRFLYEFSAYCEERRRDACSFEEYLFLNTRGSRLTEATFRKRLRTLSQDLMIEPRITPHRFRHSAATLLIEEGVDIRIVQRLLGHASIATTEIYTKVSDNALFDALTRADTLSHLEP